MNFTLIINRKKVFGRLILVALVFRFVNFDTQAEMSFTHAENRRKY